MYKNRLIVRDDDTSEILPREPKKFELLSIIICWFQKEAPLKADRDLYEYKIKTKI